MDDIRGELIDLRMMAYTFVILEVNGTNCEFAIDDIYWDGGITTSTEEIEEGMELTIVPMPVEDMAIINFNLEETQEVNLGIYDINGRLVEQLVQREFTQGQHTLNWTSENSNSICSCQR